MAAGRISGPLGEAASVIADLIILSVVYIPLVIMVLIDRRWPRGRR